MKRKRFPWLTQSLRSLLLAATGLALFTLAPSLAAQEVRLSLAEYHDLIERGRLDPAPPIEPAADYACPRAELSVELSGSSALVTSTLNIALMSDDWVHIPRPVSAKVLRADFGDFEGRLSEDGSAFVLRGRGRSSLVLEEAIALEVAEGSSLEKRTLDYTLPLAARVTGTVFGSDDGSVLELESGGHVMASSGNDLSFAGGPGQRLRISSRRQRPVGEAEDLPLRFSALSWTQMQLSRSQSRLLALVRSTILQGIQTQLEIAVPPGFEVTGIAEEALTGWQVRPGASGDVVIATLRVPNRRVVEIELELRGAPGEAGAPVASPSVELIGAVRSRQLVSTTVLGDGILTLEEPGDAVEIDRAAMAGPTIAAQRWLAHRNVAQEVAALREPASADQNSLIYQLAEASPEWGVVWPDESEVLALRIDQLLLDTLIGASGSAVYSIRMQVSSSGSQTLTLEMPDGFLLVRGERDGVRIRPSQTASGDQLVLPLEAGRANHTFDLVGVLPFGRWTDQELVSVPLPVTQAPVSQVQVRAHLPGEWRYRLKDRSREAHAGELSPITQARLLNPPPGFAPVLASWSAMTTEPGSLELLILEQKTREEWF